MAAPESTGWPRGGQAEGDSRRRPLMGSPVEDEPLPLCVKTSILVYVCGLWAEVSQSVLDLEGTGF